MSCRVVVSIRCAPALFGQVDGFMSRVAISGMTERSPDVLFDAVRHSVGGSSKQLQDMGQVRTAA